MSRGCWVWQICCSLSGASGMAFHAEKKALASTLATGEKNFVGTTGSYEERRGERERERVSERLSWKSSGCCGFESPHLQVQLHRVPLDTVHHLQLWHVQRWLHARHGDRDLDLGLCGDRGRDLARLDPVRRHWRHRDLHLSELLLVLVAQEEHDSALGLGVIGLEADLEVLVLIKHALLRDAELGVPALHGAALNPGVGALAPGVLGGGEVLEAAKGVGGGRN
mmetsp:Transcript_99/g.421  ORF Transcript_99/g.421 Transcript_99/m.421 type:complete len:224 (-) Transcript_99:2246-2917(-)